MADILELSDSTFETEVLKSDRPVVVDFWAEWCGPCRQIAPIIKQLATEYGDRVKITKLNVDEAPQSAGNFGVARFPPCSPSAMERSCSNWWVHGRSRPS